MVTVDSYSIHPSKTAATTTHKPSHLSNFPPDSGWVPTTPCFLINSLELTLIERTPASLFFLSFFYVRRRKLLGPLTHYMGPSYVSEDDFNHKGDQGCDAMVYGRISDQRSLWNPILI